MTVSDDLIQLRRTLHPMAECAFHEWNTLKFISAKARACHCSCSYLPPDTFYKYQDLIGGQAEIHVIDGQKLSVPGLLAQFKLGKGRHVALRSDLDGLPIAESTDAEHQPARLGFNARNGCMHACGHDGHQSIAVALMQWASCHPDQLKAAGIGTLSFIFQPAEEGVRGAQIIADTSWLDGVDELWAFHLGMGLPSGFIAPCPHDFMATSKFDIEIHGKSCHAGHPELGANALKAAVKTMSQALDTAEPKLRRLINFSQVSCPGARNIIPDFVCFSGEVRAGSHEDLLTMRQQLQDLLSQNCADCGCSFKLKFLGFALPIKQDEVLCAKVRAAAHAAGLKLQENFAFSASEDASLLINKVQKQGGKGCYIVIGADLSAPHHAANFDFDELALTYGFNLFKQMLCLNA